MSVTYVKIKIKSLAEEARIIRKEEIKAKRHMRYVLNQITEIEALESDAARHNYPTPEALELRRLRAAAGFSGLHRHRIDKVRPEIRAANVAYAYMRGKSFASIEATHRSAPHWNRVIENLTRYANITTGKTTLAKNVAAWAGYEIENGYWRKIVKNANEKAA